MLLGAPPPPPQLHADCAALLFLSLSFDGDLKAYVIET